MVSADAVGQLPLVYPNQNGCIVGVERGRQRDFGSSELWTLGQGATLAEHSPRRARFG